MTHTHQKHWQITGPPGTGKTTWLVHNALKAAEKFGPEKIVVASLTRAAAYEFASRGLHVVPRDQLGTLHSICLRALGRPELVGKHIDDWNRFVTSHGWPGFCLVEDVGPKGFDLNRKAGEGDYLLNRLSVLRNIFPGINTDPAPLWLQRGATQKLLIYRELWEEWKGDCGYMDFTDLLEACLESVSHAPGNPRALFGDEAQDWSRLELSLFRDKWGEDVDTVEKVILVGDPDQAIFEWRGADPRLFIDFQVPESNKRLLDQSYRVPADVRNCALAWIEWGIEDRAKVDYKARVSGDPPSPVKGSVLHVTATFRSTWGLHEILEEIYQSDEDVFILASCNYMLAEMISNLRKWGFPFDNPYRSEAGQWNPLRRGDQISRPGQRHSVTRFDKLMAYLAISQELRGEFWHEWSWQEIEHWTEPLRAMGDDSVLAYKARGRIKQFIESKATVTMTDFNALFVGINASLARTGNLTWWLSAMREKELPGYTYLSNIIKFRGYKALLKPPKIHPGTIHSVKGAQADHVILFPDLSPAGDEIYNGLDKAPVVRLFYVAITRAYKRLILCSPDSPRHVKILKTSTRSAEVG